jgi:8-oxo-dGTP diphosphatase
LDAALREAREESGIVLAQLTMLGSHVACEGGWTYTTFVAAYAGEARRASSAEAVRHGWFALPEVDALPLHPGFAASWPSVRELIR